MKEHRVYKISLDETGNEIARTLSFKNEYNHKGVILNEIEYDEKEKQTHNTLYRYSKSGNLIQQVSHDVINDLTERIEFLENEDGVIIEEKIIYNDGLFIKRTHEIGKLNAIERVRITDSEEGRCLGYENYSINEEGNLTKQIIIDEFGSVTSIFEIDYEGENVIEERKYVGKEFESKTTFTYNSSGLLIEQKEFDKEERLEFIELNHYDREGNLIEKLSKDFLNEVEVKDLFIYDKKNNLVNSKSFTDGMLIFENVSEFDESNRLIKENVIEKDIEGINADTYFILHEYDD